LVEDDPVLGRALQLRLAMGGDGVKWVRDGVDAYAALMKGDYSSLVLDLGLPGMGGLELLHRIRQTDWRLPVLIVTGRSGVGERILGLDFGADDYLVKPFDLDELFARLRAITRRARGDPGSRLAVGNVDLDSLCHEVRCDGRPVWLSAREFSVLRLLMESSHRAVSVRVIAEHLAAWGDEADTELVDSHVRSLRDKFGQAFIGGSRGRGYRVGHGAQSRPGEGGSATLTTA
jgi:two-component system response regulator QseB